MKRLNLAIVDDSPFIRKALARLLAGDPDIRVAGIAATGEELLDNFGRWEPDVITLDLCMPGMGGLSTLDRIMELHPVPVIILSTHSAQDAPLTIEALSRGAVDFIDKQQYSLVDFEALRSVLRERILQVAGRLSETATMQETAVPEPVAALGPSHAPQNVQAVVIGASTGGPPAIERILTDLGPGFQVPIVIVQHMPAGFTKAFAQRLNNHLGMNVAEAAHGDTLIPAHIYVAPSGFHVRIVLETATAQLALSASPADVPHIPSVDVLFESAACTFQDRCLGVILTGMGTDGARGMVELRKAGAHTIGQSEDSCIVYGMPKAANHLGGVEELLHIGRIAGRLKELAGDDENAKHKQPVGSAKQSPDKPQPRG